MPFNLANVFLAEDSLSDNPMKFNVGLEDIT